MTDPILAVPTANGRFYIHPGHQSSVPSITNIIGMKSKPLFRAGLKEAARYAAARRADLGSLTEDEVFKLVSNPPKADDAPSIIGDIVHNWIDRFIKSGMTETAGVHDDELRSAPNTARWMFETFLAFNNRYKPQYTASEFTVWSNRYGYAGTADWSAMLGGYHVLVDTKTGKAAYPEVAMQLAAIANADFVLDADGTEAAIPEYNKFAVLHLRPRGARLHPVDNIEAAFKCFLALKYVFDWNLHVAPRSIIEAPKIN